MEEEKGIKDNVEEVKENLQVGLGLTAGAEPREEGSMVLRTEDLVKKYGKRTVVSHVSIDVKQGEIVGLLGPNGAGKTTSLYMTVELITSNEGRIFWNDSEITREYNKTTLINTHDMNFVMGIGEKIIDIYEGLK